MRQRRLRRPSTCWFSPIFFLTLVSLLTLGGCDQIGTEQAHAASESLTAPSSRPSAEQEISTEAFSADEEPVLWLDTFEDVVAKEIDWDALIPEAWQPANLMGDIDIEDISDDDPRAQQLLDKLRDLWDQAPVVNELSGQRLKLPGFVVPLEMDATKIDQFLLVPYFGACIHVPPPPANQIVHVVMREGQSFEGGLFDTVWVSGTMQLERLSNDMGDSGYRLNDAIVAPYE